MSESVEDENWPSLFARSLTPLIASKFRNSMKLEEVSLDRFDEKSMALLISQLKL